MMWKILFVAVFAVGALAENELNELQRQQMKNLLTEACKKHGAEDKVDEVEKAIEDFVKALKTFFDPETIKKEIEDAKPKGELDEVFKKYCDKSGELKTHIHTLSSKVLPCVDVSLRERVNEFNNGTDQLIDFVCFKDGDRIALFIAEHGPECVQSKVNEIRECGEKLKTEISKLDDAQKLNIQEQCAKFNETTTCVVKSLEGCDTPTPGNMADALFKFIRNASVCKPHV